MTQVQVLPETQSTGNTVLSLTSIRKMRLEQLITLGTELGLTYSNEKKAVWVETVIRKFQEQAGSRMSGDIDLTDDMVAILADESTSKSEKMRRLYDLGVKTAQISRELNAHYSFVHTIVSKHEAQRLLSKNIQEAKQEISLAAVSTEDIKTEKPLVKETGKKVKVKTSKQEVV